MHYIGPRVIQVRRGESGPVVFLLDLSANSTAGESAPEARVIRQLLLS